jgi:hypothetical protein
MFKLVDEARAWWPVTWPGVSEDGTVVENRIEMQFRLLDADANVAFLAEAVKTDQKVAELRAAIVAGTRAESDPQPSEIYAAFLGRVVLDWRGVAAANGETLAFSPEALVRLMKVNGASDAATAAYRDCLRGRAEVRAGN